MNARQQALARNQDARDRLGNDLVFQIKQRRNDPHITPSYRGTTEPVTVRELDVLRCYSRGLTADMVAETLGITIQTVKAHTRSARPKLAAKNTMHACCEAIRRGLIP